MYDKIPPPLFDMKISPAIDVPDGSECTGCRYIEPKGHTYCMLFWAGTEKGKCIQCISAVKVAKLDFKISEMREHPATHYLLEHAKEPYWVQALGILNTLESLGWTPPKGIVVQNSDTTGPLSAIGNT